MQVTLYIERKITKDSDSKGISYKLTKDQEIGLLEETREA